MINTIIEINPNTLQLLTRSRNVLEDMREIPDLATRGMAYFLSMLPPAAVWYWYVEEAFLLN